MATSQQDAVRTTDDMKSDIVCPATLKIAVASAEQSDGRLGAIQSYRCAPRPNAGGWETRPQKGDKWAADLFKFINAPTGEEITLSDGVTKVTGFDWAGKPSDTRFKFTHEDGVRAKNYALKLVKSGKLRAPRNWDRTFADEAGMTLDDLKSTYPELYQRTSRTTSTTRRDEEDQEIESLGAGFFEDGGENFDTEGEAHIETESLDEEDDAAIAADEEEEYESEEAEVPTYSVVAEMGLGEEEDTLEAEPLTRISVQGTSHTVLHAAAKSFRADMGDGHYITYYKVRDPYSGKMVWAHVGKNEDLSHIELTLD